MINFFLKIIDYLVVKILISVGILFFILNKLSISEIASSLNSAQFSFIIAGLIIISIMRTIPAFGTKALLDLQGAHIDLSRIIQLNFATAFYGLFLPGFLSGGPVKLYKLSRFNNKSTEILTTLVFERIIDTIVLTVLGIVFFFPNIFKDLNQGKSVLFILTIILLFLLLSYYLLFNNKGYSFLKKLIDKINNPIVSGKLVSLHDKLVESIKRFNNISKSLLIYIIGISVLKHLLGVLCFYLFALSLGINISFVDFGWIRSLLLIAISVPISLSGIGIREGTLIYLFQDFGITATDTVAFSFILFIRILFVGIIGGIFEGKNLFSHNMNQ